MLHHLARGRSSVARSNSHDFQLSPHNRPNPLIELRRWNPLGLVPQVSVLGATEALAAFRGIYGLSTPAAMDLIGLVHADLPVDRYHARNGFPLRRSEMKNGYGEGGDGELRRMLIDTPQALYHFPAQVYAHHHNCVRCYSGTSN